MNNLNIKQVAELFNKAINKQRRIDNLLINGLFDHDTTISLKLSTKKRLDNIKEGLPNQSYDMLINHIINVHELNTVLEDDER